MLPANGAQSCTAPLQEGFATYAERRTHAHGKLCMCQPREPELVFILDRRRTNSPARSSADAAAIHPHYYWLNPAHGTTVIRTCASETIEALHIRMPATLFTSIELKPREGDRRLTFPDHGSMFHDSLMEQMACAIAEELDGPTDQGATLLHALIACMAARLLHRHLTTAVRTPSGHCDAQAVHEHRQSRVLRYIGEHLDAPLSIQTLAKIACLSRFHFAKEFKRVTGQSPHQYICEQRMRLASRLLKENNLRLADVATACGFLTQASFNKAFTRSRGDSPGQYRRAASLHVQSSPFASARRDPESGIVVPRISPSIRRTGVAADTYT